MHFFDRTASATGHTLADRCYYVMFYNCSSLTKAPELPATTLAESCYEFMFESCTSLVEPPVLPATNLAKRCYYCMFSRCFALTAASEMPATELAVRCYSYMYQLCTALTEPAELPATTMVDSCYMGLYWNCTSLTKGPDLPAQVLAPSCYEWMFENCTSLNEITCLATDISAENCVFEWMNEVGPSGVIYKAPEMEDWPLNSVSGIPEGWIAANYDGVEEQQGQLTVYPNPVVDKLRINDTDIQSVEVFDMQGRLVHSEDCDHADQVEIDFQGFARGIYSVSIKSAGRNVTKSVVF